MRVCIVADSASVRFGGEAILPYHYFRLLRARGVEAWLVVHDRTRDELTALLPQEQGRIFYTRDLPLHRSLDRWGARLPRRIAEATLDKLSKLITQREQRKMIRRLVHSEGVDVVHQPTPVSPRHPSLMAGLGVPVVVGPLNGGMEYPPAFRGEESFLVRSFIWWSRTLSDLVHLALPGKRKAATVLVANERTRSALPRGLRGEVRVLVENAVDQQVWSANEEAGQTERSRTQFLFIGRLVDWKRLDIALRAVVQVPTASLAVVGEGSSRQSWEAQAQALGIADRVRFHGWQSQTRCAEMLSQSAALLLPSVYECGGAVVLEAMALGRPVIATHWGGPADYLDKDCGLLVEPFGEEAMVEQFARNMQWLLDHPEHAESMGRAGKQKVAEHFTWARKIDAIEQIYRGAIDNSSRLAVPSRISETATIGSGSS